MPLPMPTPPRATSQLPPSKRQSKVKPKRAKVVKPGPPSPMAMDFRHLPSGWRSYIDYVSIAASGGDKGMARYFAAYLQLSPKEHLDHTPERLCDLASVKPADLFGAVSGAVWESSRREASMLIAVHSPRIIEKTAKLAMQPKNYKDREMFNRGTGFLPTPKGAQILINNSPNMIGGSSNAPLTLPSLESEMLSIEALDPPMLTGETYDVGSTPSGLEA